MQFARFLVETPEYSLETDHPAVVAVAAARKISTAQVMYAYVSQHNISVLSTFNPTHMDWMTEDIGTSPRNVEESKSFKLRTPFCGSI